jgi:subtilisin family serine protease
MTSPHRPRLYLVVALVAIALCAGSSAGNAGVSSGNSSRTRLLVHFKSTVSRSAAAATLARAGVTRLRSIPKLGVQVVTAPAGSAAAALARLKAASSVSFAERDTLLQPQEVLPNDPYFLNSGAWNLGGGAWGWYVTHTAQAWDITKGAPSTVIAVLDTGIKPNGLADFNGQIASTWNVLNQTADATTNAGNHGTYVAGVAGLAMDNGAGNAGYCPQCRLMIVQVGYDSGAYLSDIASGLTYAADHGARVASMSWAGTTDSATLQSAINYAHNHGLVLTAAAGNSNCDCPTYPSADQNVLGVAGVANAAGDKQGDSNYGAWVKVAAPEGDMTAWPSINGAPGYAAVGGTSMAAPAAAGIAGLLFSYNPALTNTQVEQALELSAAPVRFSVAYGRVDALAALQYLGASDTQPSSPPVQTAAPQIYYELNGWTSLAPLEGPPQPGQILVRGIGGWTGSSGLTVTGLQWRRCDSSGASCTTLTNQSIYAVQASDAGYTIKLAFTVQNALGSVAASVLSEPVGGSPPPPPPPSPPSNTAAPAISGTAQDGAALTASTGTWGGSPTAYAYQWQRCDSSGGNCAGLAGATASSYLVQTADVDSTLVAVVTASNSAGSASAASAPTAVVTTAPAPPPPSPPAMQTQTFNGSLNAKNPGRSFNINVGAGTATAQLSFSRCTTLSLALTSGGSPVGSANGPSVVTLVSSVSAGGYTYLVSGGRCSFTLTVTAPAG